MVCLADIYSVQDLTSTELKTGVLLSQAGCRTGESARVGLSRDGSAG